MPVQARREGEDLLVDNVDIKRAARTLLQMTRAAEWQSPKDISQAMEMMARVAGFPNLHAASAQATRLPPDSALAVSALGPTRQLLTPRSDGHQMVRMGISLADLTTQANELPQAGPNTARAATDNAGNHVFMMSGSALGKGAALHPAPDTFPDDCNPRFDQRWKNLASAGFYASLAGVAHGGDIVAIIGRPGTGKSLLVNAMAKSMGGAVVDFRLKTWQEDFDLVRRVRPNLVFIEELYYHSEATELEVVAFALGAKSTKTVFVFQDYDTLVQSMFRRRDMTRKPFFALARVLDLDRMALSTVYAEQPMAVDRLHHARLDETPRLTPSATSSPIWVRLQFECVGNSYEAELLPNDLRILTEGATPGAVVQTVSLSIMKTHPDGAASAEEIKTLTAKEWDDFVETVDPAVFHRECTESGHIDIARAMELAQRGPSNTSAPRRNRPR